MPAAAEDRGRKTEDRAGAGVEEDAVAAVSDRRSASPDAEDGGHRPPLQAEGLDDGAPVGPSEGEEAAFLAEQREQGFGAPASGAAAAKAAAPDPDEKTPLPPLDDLVNRIPAATRELMDELFRAKFVTVKRVPKSALKN